MRRIGIMGGTFNPIHIGHLTLAEWASDALELDEVWFIPAGITHGKSFPGKPASTGPDNPVSARNPVPSARERLCMTELAVRDNPSFQCLAVEVEREGYTYSYETMEQMKTKYPEDSFFFLVGADCLFTIENWKNPDRFFGCCTLAASMRGNATLQEMEEKKRWLEQKYNGSIILLPFINLAVSSSEIRLRVCEGRSVRYLVPDSVLAYIKEKGFYREENKQLR